MRLATTASPLKPKVGAELPEWIAQFEFSPQTIGGFSYGHLALVSVLGLFLELLMIRWISSK